MVVENVKDIIAKVDSNLKFRVGESVLSRSFELWQKMMSRKIEHIASDLYAACRLGLISESDARESIQWCNNYKRTMENLYRDAYIEKIGEEAYEREWCKYHDYDYDYYKTL